MSRNGSGLYTLYTPGNPVVTGTTISSSWANNTLSDIATALTQSIAKDGQTVPTANLPMGGFKLTGLAAGNAAGNSLRFEQLFSQGAPTDIASAATVDIGSQNTNFLNVTGATTITSFGTNYNGPKMLKFTGILILTHNATTLVLPGGANITTAENDTCIAIPKSTVSGTGDGWIILAYQRAAGIPALSGANSDITSLSAVTHTSVDSKVQEFRLTLTTATPVTTSDVTGATTIYCTPYKGNRIALYDGTNWNIRTSAEVSLALGTLTSGIPYDVFCYDNAGTPTLEFLAWTNTTTRATGLTYQDGVLVKSGTATRRYLGTFMTTSTTQTEDSLAKRFLWNYYNRCSRPMRRYESTASWTYTTATWRQANNSAANQLAFVVGVAEDEVRIDVDVSANNTSSCQANVAIGINVTNSPTSRSSLANIPAAGWMNYSVNYTYIPSAGYSYAAWLEYSQATGTTTWRGANSPENYGLEGSILA